MCVECAVLMEKAQKIGFVAVRHRFAMDIPREQVGQRKQRRGRRNCPLGWALLGTGLLCVWMGTGVQG